MSLIGWLFGAPKLQSEGDRLDAELAALNQKEYGEGGRIYNQIEAQRGTAAADAAYRQTLANQQTGATGNVDKQISDAFDEGLNDGANNVTGFVSGVFKTIGKALGAVLLGIPVWIWLGLAVGAFFYLGGGAFLRRKLAKA